MGRVEEINLRNAITMPRLEALIYNVESILVEYERRLQIAGGAVKN